MQNINYIGLNDVLISNISQETLQPMLQMIDAIAARTNAEVLDVRFTRGRQYVQAVSNKMYLTYHINQQFFTVQFDVGMYRYSERIYASEFDVNFIMQRFEKAVKTAQPFAEVFLDNYLTVLAEHEDSYKANADVVIFHLLKESEVKVEINNKTETLGYGFECFVSELPEIDAFNIFSNVNYYIDDLID